MPNGYPQQFGVEQRRKEKYEKRLEREERREKRGAEKRQKRENRAEEKQQKRERREQEKKQRTERKGFVSDAVTEELPNGIQLQFILLYFVCFVCFVCFVFDFGRHISFVLGWK